MDGIKECYKIAGAITISMSAWVYATYMNTLSLIIFFIGNIIGQILFEEAYKK